MTANTNALSYNQYIAQIAALAVYQTQSIGGVTSFLDAPPTLITPSMLNYAELRIQRDLDLLASQTSNNTYTLTAGSPILDIPIDDFQTLQTFEITQMNGAQTVNASPLLPVSKEFIQNVYGGMASVGTPQYYALVGDTFGGNANTLNKVLLGPTPNFNYTVRVTGTIVTPSLFKYASIGVADTSFTYISSYYPDMLIMASMIYITMFQRNFGNAS